MVINISVLIKVHLLVNGKISNSDMVSNVSVINERNEKMLLCLDLRNLPVICQDEQRNPLPCQKLRQDNKYFVEEWI